MSIFPLGAEECSSNFSTPAECPITSDMVSYLNLSRGFHDYFPAYCLNPPSNDGCPYQYCPNPDIGGPLVRISAYVTNLFVAILIFHNHEELQGAFWSQILTVYSLLITCGISIIQRQLTRIHAILATATAGSPLNLYITIYAIRSIWGDDHLLAPVLKGHKISRAIVLIAFSLWVALVIYIILPSHLSFFAQLSCEQLGNDSLIKYFYFLPIVLFTTGFFTRFGQWVVTIPLQIAIFSWIVAIWLRRREIWPKGEKYSFRFRRVWQVVGDNYPFTQFMSIVFLPFGYWVSIIEIGTSVSNDDHFSATFGQVLAMFVMLPPLFQALMLAPRCGRWFIDLTWVRLFTCRRRKQQRRSSLMDIPLSMRPERYDTATKTQTPLDTREQLMGDNP